MPPNLQPMRSTELSENLSCSLLGARRKRPHYGCVIACVGGEVVHPPEDARFIRWRLDEAFDMERPRDALLLDLSGLTGPPLNAAELLPALVRRRQYPVRVLLSPQHAAATDWPEAERSTSTRRALHVLDAFDPQPMDMRISELIVAGRTWSEPGLARPGLAISISGTYGHGSGGSDDARLIHWRISQFQEQIQPFGVVVDLRDFRYEWGDDLSPYPLGFSAVDSPIRFVVRPDSVAALSYVVAEPHMTFDEELAYAQVQSLGRARESHAS